MSTDWLAVGKDAIKEADGASRSSKATGDWIRPDRHWQPYNSMKELVFIDDDGAGVYEHAPFVAGSKRGNQFTCPGSGSECCEVIGSSYKERYLIVFYTVVDCTGWVDRNGKERKFQLRLFGGKYGTYDKLSVKKGEEGGLAGRVITSRRYSQQMEPGVGSEHTIKRTEANPSGTADLAKLFRVTNYKGRMLTDLYDEAEKDPAKMKELTQLLQVKRGPDGALLREVPAFNYAEALRPPTDEELTEILEALPKKDAKGEYSGATSGGASGGAIGGRKSTVPKLDNGSALPPDDEVPF